jgi:hypothetical protein
LAERGNQTLFGRKKTMLLGVLLLDSFVAMIFQLAEI